LGSAEVDSRTGASLSITIIVSIAYFVGGRLSEAGASHDALYVVVLVLLSVPG